MPNWCENTLTLSHEDPEMIERAKKAIAEDKLLSEFIPIPQELKDTVSGFFSEGYAKELNEFKQQLNIKYFGATDWYDWAVKNWGTKWDICEAYINREYGNTIEIVFTSAWSPPIGAYERLSELGFDVVGLYYEGGCCFCGKWDNGDDEYYDIQGNSDWVKNNIPKEIDEEFCISANMSEWEEEENA